MPQLRIQTILAILIILFTSAILIGLEKSNPFFKQQTEEIHHHAAFRIYVDGVLQDFTGIEYMSLVPCDLVGSSKKESDHTDEKDFLHLHDNVGDVVHIHGPGRTWGHVFDYVKLDRTNELTAYNGQSPITDSLVAPITSYQSMTFFIGNEPTNKNKILASPITKSYIQEIEKKSETCATP